ncbi:histidine kinase dimerization/phospho-acceptor domain-containing protein [Marinobacterium jannaschii]|uniref:histidine kinase dimerization/phospho-acceptor domain-containing protein n=1 Tax=Marinobacterium jannaschii TaxID=64970 RepID=UPI000488F649|nr:histidine kinase dimerization/phospho-acceptor domain-containing protein [Marinobacterium jannaschii]
MIIGLLLARQIARLVQALQRQIRATDPNDIAYEPPHRADEFGEVSQAYSETLERIRSAFEREKRFSGYASHELRTPVAIIKSSLNLWQNCQVVDNSDLVKQKRHAAVQRIAIAFVQMEEVIETFLLLSRSRPEDQDLALIDLH